MEIFIYIIGGLIAGIATGLVGLSAATIIAPLFATMLGMDPYVAIGIALASDVFASATSASNYFKNKNIDLKNASGIAVSVIVFAIVASYLSYMTKPEILNTSINIFVFILGIRFIVYPVKKHSIIASLAGKYKDKVEKVDDLEMAKEEAMKQAMGEKYDLPH